MKLKTKISLGMVASLFFFFSIFLPLSLQQSRNEILVAVMEEEARDLESKVRDYRNELLESKKIISSYNSINYLWSIFQDNFDMSCAYYVEGEEICNLTPYEFDCEMINEQIGQMEKRNLTSDKNLLQVYQFIQNIGEQRLLISVDGNQKGLILQYKDISNINKQIWKFFLKGMLFSFILILVSTMVLRWMAKECLRSFYQLWETSNEIAAGAYEKRVQVYSDDESARISESFNQIAEQVQICEEELSRTNLCQKQIIGNLSHELKTPMMAIQGYAEFLQHFNVTEAQQKKAMDYIESECRRLCQLLEKMQELTSLCVTDGTLGKKKISVKELFFQVKAAVYGRMEKKNIHLQIQIKPENLTCVGDWDLLKSLLVNLVDNGCKASMENSEILLGADEKGFFVQDWGRGIPFTELDRVTEVFYKVDKSRTRREDGAGLGLTICYKIAEVHNASLFLESKVEEGTKVFFVWKSGQSFTI